MPRRDTPSRGRYALGWGDMEIDWSPRPLLFHGGSNTKNVAQIWLDTGKDFAMVLMTNIGGETAEQGLYAVAGMLYRRFQDEAGQ